MIFVMARQQFNVNIDPDDVTVDQDSRRPDNTAFKQQRLSAWQPVLSPKSVLPLFLVIGIIFIPLGAFFLVESNNVFENVQEYTRCTTTTGTDCSSFAPPASCDCVVTFEITEDVSSTVFVYYGLSNFYQNHRRYVKSRDDKQLIGEDVDANSISSDCAPYRLDGDGNPIAPCGAIANSLFNDTYTLRDSAANVLAITRTGIAWDSDHNVKFNNPAPQDNLTAAFSSFVKPFYWSQRVEELDDLNADNNGYKNEAFEVWMRTAAFPTFRKLYGRIESGLSAGNYTMSVKYNYPVVKFDGEKRIILSTVSWLGGKNQFIGIAYIVVGALSLVTGLVLVLLNQFRPKK